MPAKRVTATESTQGEHETPPHPVRLECLPGVYRARWIEATPPPEEGTEDDLIDPNRKEAHPDPERRRGGEGAGGGCDLDRGRR